MELLKIFNEIDIDRKGVITEEQLVDFQERNRLTDFAERWLNMFDLENEGKIRIENFASTVGLEPEDYVEQAIQNHEESSQFMENVELIKVDDNMPQDLQDAIINTSLDAMNNYDKESQMAKHIKVFLDESFGKVWHAVVGKSQFGSNISHLPESFMHYKIEDHAFLIFKTPNLQNDD